jgi:hypothetical protein
MSLLNSFCDRHLSIVSDYLEKKNDMDANGVIFLIDSSGRERMVEAREELYRVLENPNFGSDLPLLVLGNGIDLTVYISSLLLWKNHVEVLVMWCRNAMGIDEMARAEMPTLGDLGDIGYIFPQKKILFGCLF